jgi:hypothetical protein
MAVPACVESGGRKRAKTRSAVTKFVRQNSTNREALSVPCVRHQFCLTFFCKIFLTTKPRSRSLAFNARNASPTFPGGAQCVFLALRQLYVQARGIAQEGWRVKRFTATEKWNDPWFRRLSPLLKCFWIFVLDNCDLAGVWKVDMEVANFFIGGELTEQIVLEAMPGRFKKIDDDHWFITKFINFQYGDLKPDCRPHQAVIRLLDKNGLLIQYQKGINTLKDKDKEKEKDLGKKKGIGEEKTLLLNRVRGLFNKRSSTPLDLSEQRAWDKARRSVESTTEDEWQLLDWAYRQTQGDAHHWRRKDMATLLNNWNGEINRALEWRNGSKQGKAMRRVSEIDGSLL